MTKIRHLRIAQWNVKGLTEIKQNNSDFVHKLNKFDIIFLTESWLTKKVEFANFQTHCLPATKMNSRGGRYSGGIIVLIRENITKYVKLHMKKDYGLWLKINKSTLNMDENLYIGGIYLPPSDSRYAIPSVFETIEKDIVQLSETGNILLTGDYNARTGNLPDYVLNYKGDEKAELNHITDCQTEPVGRVNLDVEHNCYGQKLLNLCKNLDLLLLNGRTIGDVPGMYTFHGQNGSSTIDYGIVTNTLFQQILYFHVEAPDPWSDHSLTKLCIKLPWVNGGLLKSRNKEQPGCHGFKWTQSSPNAFTEILKSDVLQSDIQQVLARIYKLNEGDTDQLSNDVANIYQKASYLSLKLKQPRRKQAHRRNKYTATQEKEYVNLKNQLKSLGILLQKYPTNPYIRGQFYHLKRNFNSILKKANIKKRETILNKIQELEDKNPAAFWNLVNSLRNKKTNEEVIDPEVFYEYFKQLHAGAGNVHHDHNFKAKIDNMISKLAGNNWVNILDKSISQDELKKVVPQLKNRKASSFDHITNEMIKHSVNSLSGILLKLFNHILHSECFPKAWVDGYINPLFKKGDVFDPSNYRGITISTCLGKLFTRLLNNRFMEFLIKNKIIHENQIGFTPGKRTTDHIFVLKTLLDQTKYSKKHLYMCFVDLKAAFDTVWHNGLVYKLIKINTSIKFVNIIKNMYSKIKACVKHNEGYTDSFPVSVGTRQGCNLSPALFNVFVNDLPGILDELQCNQPEMVNRKISSLLYADDLILFSHTPNGLQKLIFATEHFCNKWQLTINVNKTKILVAFKRNTKDQTFILYNQKIEIVSQFCYLGVIINNKGNFNDAMNRLHTKAFKAYMSLKQSFSFYKDSSAKVMIRLFETMIQPVLLYGSEVWGIYGWRKNSVCCIKNFILSRNHRYESLHSKICKHILGIDRQCPDILAKAELGRYPLMGNIIKYTYSYWQHILLSEKSSLIQLALTVNINLDRKGFTSYYSRIKGLLTITEQREMIYPSEKAKIKYESNKLRSSYYKIYDKFFFQYLNDRAKCPSAGKFTMYCLVKKNYNCERYIHKMKSNLLRRHLTGLRCAANLMPINKLRKQNIPRENRLCHLCENNRLGNELHILLHCKNETLLKYRKSFFNSVTMFCPQFDKLNNDQAFIYLLNCSDDRMNQIFAIFLERVHKLLKKKI